MSTEKELSTAYDPAKVEDKIYQKWEDSGYFNPDKLPGERAEVFSVSMPPPNVTGVLHLGHALENALMDVEIRYKRLSGKKTLLLPGTDHAAVATQAKVEKILIEEKGIKDPRKELGREKLLEVIREFSEESKATILKQIRKMGTSCDWSRLAYTFDEQRSRAVNAIFKKMYDDGLIYRGHRVINWSVKGQSTCSDEELEYEEQKTTLYTFKYSKDFPISIATTRPETKLGDTAVAVNPSDKRYKKYIGKTFTVDVGAEKPLSIKVIGEKSIDQSFGTGAVGVTPAHSMVDYEMYLAHKLELIQVIGQDGKMTAAAGKNYQGLSIKEAREKFVAWLRENELIEKEEEIVHNIGKSDRFKDIVEVLPMTQWFVDVNKVIPGRKKSLKDLMKAVVTKGHNNDPKQKIEITPERFQKTYLHWIDNLRPWCISRQIWWGHRIPVWYHEPKCTPKVGREKDMAKCQETIVSEKEPKCEFCDGKFIQDPDTLDTWFSSGLWTFSTLGYPEKTTDLKTYHPTSWMQMGYEILFFWMARMILMSTYALDEIPFKKVYIHGILRDKQGRKFSKSMGTGIDPLEIINKYGTDALRLSLLSGVTPGNDARFYEEKVEGARNFVNKLWNISRYIITSANEVKIPDKTPEPKTIADKWMLQKLETLEAEVTSYMEKFEFSSAAEKLKEFTWDDLADWYLEISKIEKGKDEILLFTLNRLLILWHPFIPFVTEHIYQNLHPEKMLMVEQWSTHTKNSKSAPDKTKRLNFSTTERGFFNDLVSVIKEIRATKSDYNLATQKEMTIIIRITDQKFKKLFDGQVDIIKYLANCSEVKITTEIKNIPLSVKKVVSPITEVVIPLEGLIDLEKEKARLTKEIELAQKSKEGVKARINSNEFQKKAPPQIYASELAKLKELGQKIEKLNDQLKTLG
jgi:valyl-tRNA synthetase